jgi:hypothetical protein
MRRTGEGSMHFVGRFGVAVRRVDLHGTPHGTRKITQVRTCCREPPQAAEDYAPGRAGARAARLSLNDAHVAEVMATWGDGDVGGIADGQGAFLG